MDVDDRAPAAHDSSGRVALPPSAVGGPAAVSVDHLLSASRQTLRLVVGPGDGSCDIRRTCFAEDDDLTGAGPADLVFGVGIGTGDGAVRALRAAGRTRAAGLVVREDLVSSAVVESAWSAGVTLLSVRARTPWSAVRRSIDDLLQNAHAGSEYDAEDANALFELCEVFADSLGGPVAIEDAEFSVVAYSARGPVGDEYRQQAILQRRTLDDWIGSLRRRGLMNRLRSTADVLKIEYGELAPRSHARLLTGIRHGSELLGVIWACEGTASFPAEAVSIVGEFADLAAPLLSRQRIMRTRRHDRIGQLLLELLEGGGDHRPLLAAWNRSEEADFVLAAIQSWPACLDPRELAEMLAVQLGSLSTSAAAVAPAGAGVYLVAAVDSDTDAVALEAGIATICQRVEIRSQVRLITALATPTRATQIRNARLEADRVSRALRHPASTARTAHYADVVQLVTLMELESFLAERPHLTLDKLVAIVEHDRRCGTSYLATLRAFLVEFGHIGRSAKAVCLHPNSFRYRIRRIVELFGLDLDDPKERFVLDLHMHCGRFADLATGPPNTSP